VLLVAVFVLGAVCGAALFYLGQRSVQPAHRLAGGPPDHPMARMTRELGLDPEQQAAIREILDEQRAQLGAFLEGSREKIREVLRPEQQELFDTMRPADPARPAGPPPGHRPPPRGGHPQGYPPPPPPQNQAPPG